MKTPTANELAARGKFSAAELAAVHGQGDKKDIAYGADAYMHRTLSPELYEKWRRGKLSQADVNIEDLEFWGFSNDL